MNADEIRAAHVYGPIHDDLGHHIDFGCTWDHEAWPCQALIRLRREELARG